MADMPTIKKEEVKKHIDHYRKFGLDEFLILSKIAQDHPKSCKTQTVQNIVKRCKTINVLLVIVSILLPPLAPGLAILIVDNARIIKQAESPRKKSKNPTLHLGGGHGAGHANDQQCPPR